MILQGCTRNNSMTLKSPSWIKIAFSLRQLCRQRSIIITCISRMTLGVPSRRIQVWTFSMTTFSLTHTINRLDQKSGPHITKRTAYIQMRHLTLDFTKLSKHQRQRNPRWSMNLIWIMTQIVTLPWKPKERGMSSTRINITLVIFKSPKLIKYLIIPY